MLPVSFQIFLRNARPAAVSKWAGQGGFLVAFHQMWLGICVLELFRASLALEHCSVQCFLCYIVDASFNEGFLSTICTAFISTYPVCDAWLAVELVAVTARDHVFYQAKANQANKVCYQLLVKGLVWRQIIPLFTIVVECVYLFLSDLIKWLRHIPTI